MIRYADANRAERRALTTAAMPAWSTVVLIALIATASVNAQTPPAEASGEPAASDTAAPPNVVVFLVDDMGWQDTSVPFHTEPTPLNRRYRTPAMERLAAGGMRFTQAYACCVCTPTRVSLLTGLNAARHRATNWVLNKNTATDAPHPTVLPPPWNVNGLSLEPAVGRAVCAPSLPQLLHGAGYRTILVGKAHFGAMDTPGADPRNLGFDVNIAGHAAGAPASYLGERHYSVSGGKTKNIWDVPGLDKYHGTDVFLTEALTREAIGAVDRALDEKRPFLLYMAHYAVHTPYSPDRRYVEKYRKAGFDETEAMYAALIEGMDKSLGDILDHLRRRKVDERTIVLFLSDNGGLSAVARGGTPHTHNAPLSSGKGSAREGGIRVPMLVRWPGVVRPGSTCGRYVIVDDVMPTLLEASGVGARLDVKPSCDGVSFVPMLRETATGRQNRPLYWHYPHIWGPTGPGLGPFSAVRQGDWKLIYYHADRRFELFNVAEDVSETRNRAADRPDLVQQLAQTLSDWFRTVDAQMPTDRRNGQPVPLPDEALRRQFAPSPARL